MQANENCRGAKNRIMILMYITWLTLSLAPAMVAPPERGFAQGQPEMQQAMDNMVTHKTIITKRMNAPSSDGTDYHSVLKAKTSNLLAEAEQVLSSLPNSKERQWIEAFVQRMKAIATMLEKTAQNKNVLKSQNNVNGTPVPEGLPLQPTWPATSAVPGINPVQKTNRMMSKFPVTSPELSKVLPANEYPSERQVVTKPAVLSNNTDEEDELVRELESLHQEHPQQEHLENYKVLDQTPVFTPSTPISLESSTSISTDVEAEKAKLQAKLIQEIAQFQRLGGVMLNDVINALQTDNHRAPSPDNNENTNTDDKLKFTEAGMVDRHGLQKMSDLSNEEKEISKANLQNSNSENNIAYHDNKQLPQATSNHSFQNIPPNFHPNLQAYPKHSGNYLHYMYPQNKLPYQGGFQNSNPYIHGKYPTNQQLSHVPLALKQIMFRPQNNYYNGHPPSDYNEYLMRHGYGPYPYMHNWDPKNSTLHLPPMMPPYSNKQPLNHQIDTQLSDEMKRQLRDGKIIVLSDSVVRSNFDTNNEETTASTPDTPKPEDNKNVTATEN